MDFFVFQAIPRGLPDSSWIIYASRRGSSILHGTDPILSARCSLRLFESFAARLDLFRAVVRRGGRYLCNGTFIPAFAWIIQDIFGEQARIAWISSFFRQYRAGRRIRLGLSMQSGAVLPYCMELIQSCPRGVHSGSSRASPRGLIYSVRLALIILHR